MVQNCYKNAGYRKISVCDRKMKNSEAARASNIMQKYAHTPLTCGKCLPSHQHNFSPEQFTVPQYLLKSSCYRKSTYTKHYYIHVIDVILRNLIASINSNNYHISHGTYHNLTNKLKLTVFSTN